MRDVVSVGVGAQQRDGAEQSLFHVQRQKDGAMRLTTPERLDPLRAAQLAQLGDGYLFDEDGPPLPQAGRHRTAIEQHWSGTCESAVETLAAVATDEDLNLVV